MNTLDTVVLRRAVPEAGLEIGDVGAVVHVHPDDSCEVEFITGEGATVAVVTLNAADLRTMGGQDILHVRTLAHP